MVVLLLPAMRTSCRQCAASALACSYAFVCVQTEGITEILQAPGKLKDRIQGMSGTRNLSDNLSDLKAQVIPSK